MSAKLDHQLASALGSAEGYKRLADRNANAKQVAQAHAKWLQSVIDDARREIDKPFRGDESLAERLRRVAIVLDRRAPTFRLAQHVPSIAVLSPAGDVLTANTDEYLSEGLKEAHRAKIEDASECICRVSAMAGHSIRVINPACTREHHPISLQPEGTETP